MTGLVVVVNHWGGVPHVLHGNVLAMQTWASEARGNIALSNTDHITEHAQLARRIWPQLKALGFKTVCLGATGFQSSSGGRCSSEEFPDPRCVLSEEYGIDRCSMYDGSTFAGSALVHDVEVLHEALQLIKEHDAKCPIFLWINLLSCRDVTRLRFGQVVHTCQEKCCTALPTPPPWDNRQIPKSIEALFPNITMVASTVNHRRFGEEHTPIHSGEYLTLLDRSRKMLNELQVHVSSFLGEVLVRQGHIAMTSTCSLSLGEHQCRDGNAPILECSNTFWCSTINLDTSSLLGHTCDCFLSEACGVVLSNVNASPECVVCLSQVDIDVHPFVRAKCRINDHSYVCIGQGENILHIFDVDEDPFETKDIRADVTHVLAEIDRLFAEATESYKTMANFARLRQTPTPTLLSTLPLMPRPPIITISTRPHIPNPPIITTSTRPLMPRPPPIITPSSPSPPRESNMDDASDTAQSSMAAGRRPQRKASGVRAKELRLNSMHR